MSKQQFSAAQREAIWSAHGGKCAYTQALLDISSFHIDHILPESFLQKPGVFAQIAKGLGLADDFDLRGYGNLLPCAPGANLQKGAIAFGSSNARFFLEIASSKRAKVEANLIKIGQRNDVGRVLVMLQQKLDRGEVTVDRVAAILERYADEPEEIFKLIEAMQFTDYEEVTFVRKADIDDIRDRRVRFGPNDHITAVTLTNDEGETRDVSTCREYELAKAEGYWAESNFDIKMSTWLEHQSGLLNALQAAKTPTQSYLSDPRVGIVDLSLIPFSMFPKFEEPEIPIEANVTYHDKVNDGTLIVRNVRQNLLKIEEPEGMGQQLMEVARADFNGDGIEDML